MKVIDVSVYQGLIDWGKLKAAGLEGAIIRAGYGRYETQVDRYFERNYAECKRVGIPCGAYWYLYSNNVTDLAREIVLFNNTIKGKQFELPVYIDVEDKAQTALSYQNLTSYVSTGCKMLEEYGWFSGFYTYTNFANKFNYEVCAKRFTSWLADYRSNYNKTLTRDMHQYTSSGTLAGISGRVDLNNCFKDFETIIKNAGLNNFNTKTLYSLEIPQASEGDKNTIKKLCEELKLNCNVKEVN